MSTVQDHQLWELLPKQQIKKNLNLYCLQKIQKIIHFKSLQMNLKNEEPFYNTEFYQFQRFSDMLQKISIFILMRLTGLIFYWPASKT